MAASLALLPRYGDMANEANPIGEKVRKILRERGIRQEDLAQKLGVRQNQISRLLSGDSDWTWTRIVQTADALGVAPAELTTEYKSKSTRQIITPVRWERGQYQSLLRESQKRMIDTESLIKQAVAEFIERSPFKNEG